MGEDVREDKEVEKEEPEKQEEDIVEERIYTIPLGKVWISPRKKRVPKAVRLVKKFILRHMKPEDLIISNEVNEKLWSRGIEKPPRKMRVRAVRNQEGTVTLYLAEGE
jgi:large subunit ribosomal protein L31e